MIDGKDVGIPGNFPEINPLQRAGSKEVSLQM